MCKIALIPGLKDDTTGLAWQFIKKLSKEMAGYTDDDGFGYSAIDGEGKLFGERWFNPKEAFSNRDEKNVIATEMVKRFKGMIKGKVAVYNSFGEVHEKSLRSVMLHARNATTAKVFENTHPFVIDGTALIHNGVISNHNELEKKYSTCDSEVILTEYLRHKVADDIQAIQKLAHRIDGYYACGVMSKTKGGLLVMDLFKESTARLKGYFVKELNTMVFATPGATDFNSPVKETCRILNLTIVDEFEVEDSRILRMNAMTGEVIDSIPFDSTFKDKKKKGSGGNTRGGNHHAHYGADDVEGHFNNVFRAGDRRNKSQRSFADKTKDDDLERELIEGTCYADGYKGTDLNDDTPPVLPALPEGHSTKYNIADDWEENESGTWRRKYAGE